MVGGGPGGGGGGRGGAGGGGLAAFGVEGRRGWRRRVERATDGRWRTACGALRERRGSGRGSGCLGLRRASAFVASLSGAAPGTRCARGPAVARGFDGLVAGRGPGTRCARGRRER